MCCNNVEVGQANRNGSSGCLAGAFRGRCTLLLGECGDGAAVVRATDDAPHDGGMESHNVIPGNHVDQNCSPILCAGLEYVCFMVLPRAVKDWRRDVNRSGICIMGFDAVGGFVVDEAH